MEHSAPRILLVDDDVALASMLREFLELQGFSVALAHDAETGLARLDADAPDLLVLDVMLPGISGFEALKRLRRRHDLPVVMLTARGEESERILGLMDGADDYLAKPCSPLELAVRIRAILKRSRAAPAASAAEDPVLAAGPLRLDLRRREAFAQERPLALTAAEMRVLEQLLRHPGEVLSRARLTAARARPADRGLRPQYRHPGQQAAAQARGRRRAARLHRRRARAGLRARPRQRGRYPHRPCRVEDRAGLHGTEGSVPGLTRRTEPVPMPSTRLYWRMALYIGAALVAFVVLSMASVWFVAAGELENYTATKHSGLGREAARVLGAGGRPALVRWLDREAAIPRDVTVYVLDARQRRHPWPAAAAALRRLRASLGRRPARGLRGRATGRCGSRRSWSGPAASSTPSSCCRTASRWPATR